MGLMDKVKAQASQLGQKAQEAAQEGKARLDQAQAQRSGGTMLRQLGALVYADRTGRGTPDTQTKIDSLISEISTFEQTNGLNLTADQSQTTVPPQGSPAPGPAAGLPAGPVELVHGRRGHRHHDLRAWSLHRAG